MSPVASVSVQYLLMFIWYVYCRQYCCYCVSVQYLLMFIGTPLHWGEVNFKVSVQYLLMFIKCLLVKYVSCLGFPYNTCWCLSAGIDYHNAKLSGFPYNTCWCLSRNWDKWERYPCSVSVQYLLMFIASILANGMITELSFRTILVDVYRLKIGDFRFFIWVSVQYLLMFI